MRGGRGGGVPAAGMEGPGLGAGPRAPGNPRAGRGGGVELAPGAYAALRWGVLVGVLLPATLSAALSIKLWIIPVVRVLTLTAWPDMPWIRLRFCFVDSENTMGSALGVEFFT